MVQDRGRYKRERLLQGKVVTWERDCFERDGEEIERLFREKERREKVVSKEREVIEREREESWEKMRTSGERGERAIFVGFSGSCED